MPINLPAISSEAALRSELYARSLEVEEPPRYAAEAEHRWRLASALQKSVRRGHAHCAIKFAVQLHFVDPSYCWRRLAIIALEDVGVGDPLSAAVALEACRSFRFRQRLGELRCVAAVATSLAEATKSRAVCDYLVANGNPTSTLTSTDFRRHVESYEAPWLISYLATSGRGHADLGTCVLPVWQLLNGSDVQVQAHEPDSSGDELIAGLPAAAFDQYTSDGKRVCAYLSKCPPFQAFTGAQIGMVLFHVEGAFLNRHLGCVENAVLELGAKLVDWRSVELFDSARAVRLAQLIREHREFINRVRKRVILR